MTPERIEEIKRIVDVIRQGKVRFEDGGEPIINELLAALEEAQQQNKRLEKKLQVSRDSVYPISVEKDEYKAELLEAQQAIARQRDALVEVKSFIPSMLDESESKNLRNNMGNMILHKIDVALENKEGEKTESHSCGEGGECRCIDCGGIESRTWVCEACQKKREAKGRL